MISGVLKKHFGIIGSTITLHVHIGCADLEPAPCECVLSVGRPHFAAARASHDLCKQAGFQPLRGTPGLLCNASEPREWDSRPPIWLCRNGQVPFKTRCIATLLCGSEWLLVISHSHFTVRSLLPDAPPICVTFHCHL